VTQIKHIWLKNNEGLKEEIPFSIDMWYNRHDKSWVVQLKDEDNNQLGDSTYVHSKPEAVSHVNWLKEKYNVPLIRT